MFCCSYAHRDCVMSFSWIVQPNTRLRIIGITGYENEPYLSLPEHMIPQKVWLYAGRWIISREIFSSFMFLGRMCNFQHVLEVVLGRFRNLEYHCSSFMALLSNLQGYWSMFRGCMNLFPFSVLNIVADGWPLGALLRPSVFGIQNQIAWCLGSCSKQENDLPDFGNGLKNGTDEV